MSGPRDTEVVLSGVIVRQPNYRFLGYALVRDATGHEYRLPMTGTVAQWLVEGARYRLELPADAAATLGFDEYRLSGAVPIWPLFERTYRVERQTARGKPLYAYALRAREARYERDYEAIVELEQYHYASEEEVIAVWYCERCGRYQAANARPTCPTCGQAARFHDLKSATRASRFLVLELTEREPYEPQYVGYVRADPPVPLMHRRLPDGTVEHDIRSSVFPRAWFAHPFHPTEVAGLEDWWQVQGEALRSARSPVARLARVVIHPDYRADGLGQQALLALKDWLRERWVPDMRVAKQAIEAIAMMARYNPFMEKAGFRYLWDTASGRPVLYCPLSRRAQTAVDAFLQRDPVARQHGGRLYHPRFTPVEPLATPFTVRHLSKAYASRLSIEQLSGPVRDLLAAFGVQHREVHKVIVRDAELEIAPSTVTVVVGASGSGKTTLLRILYGLAAGVDAPLYRPDQSEASVPANVRAAAFIPGDLEPTFGEAPVVQVLYDLTGDEALAVELLNEVGLADVVLYRAPLRELSTGQQERVKLAYLLAQRPNLLVVDEFAAHLDPSTALRLARRMAALARDKRVTLVVATHRPAAIEAMEPDAIYYCGYGTLVHAGKVPPRAFRVLEPYASWIVEGKKTWELRTYPTKVRGRVGVVSGGRLLGTVEVTGTRGPLSEEELRQSQDRHLADPGFLHRYARGRPLYAWELARAQKFAEPVPLSGKAGQQTWLRLDSGEPPA